jgi:hypothetical protein
VDFVLARMGVGGSVTVPLRMRLGFLFLESQMI